MYYSLCTSCLLYGAADAFWLAVKHDDDDDDLQLLRTISSDN